MSIGPIDEVELPATIPISGDIDRYCWEEPTWPMLPPVELAMLYPGPSVTLKIVEYNSSSNNSLYHFILGCSIHIHYVELLLIRRNLRDN
jgi:hypothetical protein